MGSKVSLQRARHQSLGTPHHPIQPQRRVDLHQARICIATSLTHNHTHLVRIGTFGAPTTRQQPASPRGREGGHMFSCWTDLNQQADTRRYGVRSLRRVRFHVAIPTMGGGASSSQLTARSMHQGGLHCEMKSHATQRTQGGFPGIKKAQSLLPSLQHNHNGSCPLLNQHQRAIPAPQILLPSPSFDRFPSRPRSGPSQSQLGH